VEPWASSFILVIEPWACFLFLFVPVLSDASSMSNKHNKVKQIKGLVKGMTE
jgi:hypothetical protein